MFFRTKILVTIMPFLEALVTKTPQSVKDELILELGELGSRMFEEVRAELLQTKGDQTEQLQLIEVALEQHATSSADGGDLSQRKREELGRKLEGFFKGLPKKIPQEGQKVVDSEVSVVEVVGTTDLLLSRISLPRSNVLYQGNGIPALTFTSSLKHMLSRSLVCYRGHPRITAYVDGQHGAQKAATSMTELTTEDVTENAWRYCAKLAVELARQGVLQSVLSFWFTSSCRHLEDCV